MDALRVRAFLDILLGMDSRPPGSKHDGADASRDPAQRHAPARTGAPDPAAQDPDPSIGGPLAGVIPPGFAGHVSLTIPAATLTDRADRPAELARIGPVDPDPEANTSDRYQLVT